jgi:RHS repeat-associated protein
MASQQRRSHTILTAISHKTVDGTTTTYLYDYANRLIAIGTQGATTTYAYDAFGVRVLQTGTSTTTLYPFKWYSVASSTGTGAKYATTTDYVFNGDTLLSTIDQQTASGNATGTAKTRYIHPDHLGSTNVVTDENDNVVQTLDYYPYGATRINSTSGNYPGAGRQYVNRLADQSSLDYLQNRYYDSARAQFITQDTTFLGDTKEMDLKNPQSLNSYSYANDNLIANKDANGNFSIAIAYAAIFLAIAVIALYSGSSAASHGGSGGGSVVAGNALKAADQILNTSGQATGKAIAAIGSDAASACGGLRAPQNVF